MDNNYYYAPYEEPKKEKEKKPRKRFGVTLAKCAALALVFGLISGTVFYGTGYIFQKAAGGENPNTVVQPAKVEAETEGKMTNIIRNNVSSVISDVSQVVEEAMPSIVSITSLTVQQYNTFWGTMSQETPGAGSGIIVAQTEDELFIATNNHVVAGTSELTVCFVDNTTVAAQVKGTDPSTDLAVVSVKLSDLSADTLNAIKVAVLGDSESVKVGQPAIAIGNAMGYGQSVTVGYISALNREVSVEGTDGSIVTNALIQTKVEGMGYAIPISTADSIINDLITREKVDESNLAYLGIHGVDVTDEVSGSYNMPKGIFVDQVVEGSAADQAGIRRGDIITSFDGREISTYEALLQRMQYYAAGAQVEIVLQSAQAGEYVERTVSVTMGRRN